MARMLHLIVALLLVAALAPAAAQAAGPAATRSALASQMRSAGGGSGALAVDLDTGRQIYRSRADTARTPASVNKLFTTSAALSLYGVDGHLTTRALGDVGVDPGGVLIGDLYLRGGGDPSFGSRQAGELADRLVTHEGLREVTGRVIGDESAFDSLRGPPSEGYRTTFHVGPLSALTFNRGRSGKRRPYFQVSPARFAAREFDRALRRRGVVTGAAPRTGRTPQAALSLAEYSSPTIGELARVTNRPSDNFNAETLIKALGSEFGTAGTTRAGSVVVTRTMAGFGLRPRVVDGSGLSRANRTTPRQVVRLLEHMAADVSGPAFETSLAVAGRNGTLFDRMRASVARDRCKAKTGTLNSVSALAGYCQTTAGSRVAFAFLMNGVNVYGARRLQDRMVSALARYSP
ncbi:MAG TPA: D-alanyl-D-alanine carboxypeptidase/D-alanyl-D-alanine-endopeptidase [Solirubrobacteraceae bacterium]|nr:D-alanyl-D-alanine carboxypeptidase/D-alanyl-D-alanine-endopeptidase [Solirubrobacteraceae bacterium]